jgi:hypothetical protein
MQNEGQEMLLEIAGPGIVFFSPILMSHVTPGTDYLSAHYEKPEDVEEHIQAGTLVGFCTGSSGRFLIRFHDGYPPNEYVASSDYKLRLGVRCPDGAICFKDLFELSEWSPDCPPGQRIAVDPGIYHVTLCSDMPASGILGDEQRIDVYLMPLDHYPALARTGVPSLCIDE